MLQPSVLFHVLLFSIVTFTHFRYSTVTKKESMVDSIIVLIFKDLCVIKCVKFSLLCVLPFHVTGKRHLRTEMLQVMV